MKVPHILLAILIAAIWGFNFIAVKVGLNEMPPFLYACARFVVGLPLLFLVRKPPISWGIIVGIGLTLGVAKFGFMFWGIHVGISAGLASLVLQSQAFFTTVLSVLLLGDKIRIHQLLGIAIAFCGIGIIGINLHEGSSLIGFVFILAAAISWAFSNILFKRAGNVNMFSLVVWTGLVPPLPLYLLSFSVEGYQTLPSMLIHMSAIGWACLLFTACASTWLGSTLWGILLRTYTPSQVAPYSLLIPIFGISFSHTLLSEQFTPIIYAACGLVFLGLIVNQWGMNKFSPLTTSPANTNPLLEKVA